MQRVVGGRLAQAGAGPLDGFAIHALAEEIVLQQRRRIGAGAAPVVARSPEDAICRRSTSRPGCGGLPTRCQSRRSAARVARKAVVKPSTSTPTPASSGRARQHNPPARPAVRCGASSSPETVQQRADDALHFRLPVLVAGTTAARQGWPPAARPPAVGTRSSSRPARAWPAGRAEVAPAGDVPARLCATGSSSRAFRPRRFTSARMARPRRAPSS